MPTILRTKGYRFFFYINDHSPPHIHVEKEKATAKFDLENAKLIRSKRFNAGELKEIRKLVIENSELFKIKWDENIAGN
ncbi:MAG TPA: DUF4160 domain-containing protein [Tangfeifania sp.]|nr:DUF4160 domain-containing protein [Tangfeifania sp.]